MLAYEEFESRVLVPRICGRALRLPSSVVLFALLAGGTLMGILGALLALPVAATVRMIIEELRVELPGEQEQIEDTRLREADDRSEGHRTISCSLVDERRPVAATPTRGPSGEVGARLRAPSGRIRPSPRTE